jgi:hypothetical protein
VSSKLYSNPSGKLSTPLSKVSNLAVAHFSGYLFRRSHRQSCETVPVPTGAVSLMVTFVRLVLI